MCKDCRKPSCTSLSSEIVIVVSLISMSFTLRSECRYLKWWGKDVSLSLPLTIEEKMSHFHFTFIAPSSSAKSRGAAAGCYTVGLYTVYASCLMGSCVRGHDRNVIENNLYSFILLRKLWDGWFMRFY